VTAGWVDFTGGERPLVLLTGSGRAVMKAERPARLLLPAAGGRSVHGGSPERPRPAAAKPLPGALEPAAASLFEALRAHRLALARTDGVPPFVIASDRTLREIAELRPRTLDELTGVFGIGPTKAARYGPGFLEVVGRAALE
jgi:ATP-dependent DNA helicase RecQ